MKTVGKWALMIRAAGGCWLTKYGTTLCSFMPHEHFSSIEKEDVVLLWTRIREEPPVCYTCARIYFEKFK